MVTTRVDSREVAHLWANQVQPEANNSNQSFSFRGRDLYSYSTRIARVVIGADGAAGVLMIDRQFSVTTAKQKSFARGAASHHRPNFWEVPEIGVNPNGGTTQHNVNMEYFSAHIAELAGKAQRARAHKASCLAQLQEAVENADAYCIFFGLDKRFAPPEGFSTENEGRLAVVYQEAHRALLERKEEQHKARIENEKLAAAEKLELWLNGEYITFPSIYNYNHREAGTRLRVKGSRIQTSLGAVVSVEDAQKILNLCRSGVVAEFDTSADDALKVGGYAVREVDAEGVTVGCHYIRKEEIERIAAQLGL